MNDTYYFLECTTEKIQGKQYLCFYVLNYDKHLVFRIFKKYTEEISNKINDLAIFEDISEKISFAIRRDGKIALDINF